MVFKPRQKRSICNIQVSIDNQNIVKVKEINFLGVILDENLGGRKYHMLQIKLRSQSIKYLNAVSFFLNGLYLCSTIP